jgi:NADH-quinone oxidoreductase subunit H
VILFLFFYIWLRGTLPRFRYDQLMGIAWKVLLPLVLVNILITALIRLIGNGQLSF